MSASDEDLFGTMLRIENKDIFVDLRRNPSGTYLKLSERKGTLRNTVLIPASGIGRLQAVLDEVSALTGQKKRSGTERAAGSVKTVYVSDLAWATTEDELAAHFGTVAKVVSATILTRTRRGEAVSIGCGLVEFSSAAEAALAIAQLNGTELGGRTIACREDKKAGDEFGAGGVVSAAPAEDAAPKVVVPTKVFVRSLAWATTDQSLHNFFTTVGRVVSAKVNMTPKGRSTGSGVVEFLEASDAAVAITLLDEKELDGRFISVRVYYDK